MRQVRTPLCVEDVEPPRIGPDEALIETRTSGICGTDLHILEGHGYVPRLPHILGHEPAGVVVEVGSEVDSLRPGDRVVPHLFISCGRCYYCRIGRKQQCGDLKGIIGVLCNGAFAEYFKAPARNFYLLPDAVPFDEGGLIADAVITAVHASRRATLGLHDTALVVGAGGVGQVLIQILRAGGVRVAAADINPDKRQKAEERTHQCRLAGTVLTDDRVHLSGARVERDLAIGPQLAEADAHASELDQRRAHGLGSVGATIRPSMISRRSASTRSRAPGGRSARLRSS